MNWQEYQNELKSAINMYATSNYAPYDALLKSVVDVHFETK